MNTKGREINRGYPDATDGVNLEGTSVERLSAPDWPFEGVGIEGSEDSTLLFELGPNDHEFRFVIME